MKSPPDSSLTLDAKVIQKPNSAPSDHESRTGESFQRGLDSTISSGAQFSDLPVPLERDVFLRTLLRHLAGTLQKVVGLEEASGFVSVVGQEMGEEINQTYKNALSVSSLSRDQVSEVLVDLKRRIQGDFFIIEEDDEKIVLGNRVCPFAEKVIGRPALCMMTSNVFGHIAAENLGYSKVVIEQAIARGDVGCRVVVYLKATGEANAAQGREYFKA
jgi:hypothetical protein